MGTRRVGARAVTAALPPPAVPGFFTVPELARALDLPQTTVRHHCRAGWLKGDAILTTNQYMIPVEAAQRFATLMRQRRAEIARRLT